MTNAQRIDRAIALFSDLKSEIESRERLIQKVRGGLVSLARAHGFRRRGAWLVQGERNQALLTRDIDVLIARQDLAAQLPGRLRRLYLQTRFLPSELLKLLVKNHRAPSTDHRPLARFLKRAVRTRRHWRVAWLHLARGSGLAPESPRAKPRGRPWRRS